MNAVGAKTFRTRAVLAFEDARLPTPQPGAPPLDIDFRLMEGEIAWVRANRQEAATTLVDAACGLLAPAAGAVRFAGLDWRDLGREQAGALRGRIGRLLPFDLWAPHLSLAANIALRPLHHTDRAEAGLLEEAAALSRRFGLPGAPVMAPRDASRDDLWRASLARMMMDAPRLILIDELRGAIPAALVERTANTVLRAVRAGAAALWLTRPRASEGPALMADAVAYRLDRFGLAPLTREAAR